jgi:hypothetical protein
MDLLIKSLVGFGIGSLIGMTGLGGGVLLLAGGPLLKEELLATVDHICEWRDKRVSIVVSLLPCLRLPWPKLVKLQALGYSRYFQCSLRKP